MLRAHRGIAFLTGLVCALLLLPSAPSRAQSGPGTRPALNASPTPVPPAVVSQDNAGHVTIRATRVTEPIKIDGKLDDRAYSEVQAISGLIQLQPRDGEPVSEKTEMWILFDNENLYVACRCWQRNPKTLIFDDMRRDTSNNGDYISISLDTFHDRRNSYLFYVNPMGGIMDVATSDERSRNNDWNGVWNAAGGRFDGGWVSEMAIPFKSLRYRPGRDQVWGVILRRRIRHNGDEHSYLPPFPQAYGNSAVLMMSEAATLVGLQAPPPALSLEVKPYVVGQVRTDVQASPPVSNHPNGDLGFDAKYGVTKGLTLDVTYNTDFAQVEADVVQVNLTRFSLMFPEKREFFLEGQGIFSFGGANSGVGGSGGGGGGGAGGGGGRNGNGNDTADVPVMFFSRRIGLHEGRPVPIVAGARLTGRAGPYSIGALSIETDDDATSAARRTNFTVARVQRSILRRSSIGALVTERSNALAAGGSNQLYGIDGLFSFFQALNFNAYVAKTQTAGLTGRDLSYRGQLDYAGDRYGLQIERMKVGDNFRPEVGFLRREAFRRTFGQARFSPRPHRSDVVRRYNYEGSIDYITDNFNRLESRNIEAVFRTEFQSSNQLAGQYNSNYELVEQPFTITEGVKVPVGGYDFQNVRASYTIGQQHHVSGTAAAERGGFYGGNKTTASFQGRVKTGIRLAFDPNVSVNWINLPHASFVNKVISTRGTYNFSPRMYVSALVQYSSSSTSFATNVRFRWEYRPGSDLFIVYTEGRDTFPVGRIPLENRGFVVKFNRLVRF